MPLPVAAALRARIVPPAAATPELQLALDLTGACPPLTEGTSAASIA